MCNRQKGNSEGNQGLARGRGRCGRTTRMFKQGTSLREGKQGRVKRGNRCVMKETGV